MNRPEVQESVSTEAGMGHSRPFSFLGSATSTWGKRLRADTREEKPRPLTSKPLDHRSLGYRSCPLLLISSLLLRSIPCLKLTSGFPSHLECNPKFFPWSPAFQPLLIHLTLVTLASFQLLKNANLFQGLCTFCLQCSLPLEHSIAGSFPFK